jgi:hypothetical protein
MPITSSSEKPAGTGTWTLAWQWGQHPLLPAKLSFTRNWCPLGQQTWIDIAAPPVIRLSG